MTLSGDDVPEIHPGCHFRIKKGIARRGKNWQDSQAVMVRRSRKKVLRRMIVSWPKDCFLRKLPGDTPYQGRIDCIIQGAYNFAS